MIPLHGFRFWRRPILALALAWGFGMATEAILDTNVLVAGLRSRHGASAMLLRLVAARVVVPVVSVSLAFEYEAVLKREAHAFLAYNGNDLCDAFFDAFLARSRLQLVYFRWRPGLADPGDDHVLELAVAAGGPPIVTHNTRDFAGADRFGMSVLSPAEFLRTLSP